MIGIIKGNILDAKGDPIVPGEPVTITCVRSDGGDDIAIVTDNDGNWSFNLSSEKVGECDITFMYNGLEIGSYEVFFVDNFELKVLPYSSTLVHKDHSALIAYAVIDPDGKGVPNAPVTFYDDSSSLEPTMTINTDRFGIVEFLVTPTDVIGERSFNATIGKTMTKHTVEWTTDQKSLVYGFSDFMHTEEVESGVEGMFTVYGVDQYGKTLPGIDPHGEVGVTTSFYKAFNKDTLSDVELDRWQDRDGREHLFTSVLDDGEYRICFYAHNARKDVTMTWQDQPSGEIASMRNYAPGATKYPTVVPSVVKCDAVDADGNVIKVRGKIEVRVMTNNTSIGFPKYVLPDGTFRFFMESAEERDETKRLKIGDTLLFTQDYVYRDGFAITKCEYGNDEVPTGENGFVAFGVTNKNDKLVANAAVWYTNGLGEVFYTSTPDTGNRILEVPISQEGKENRIYEEITAHVGDTKAVAGTYWRPTTVPVGTTLEDVVFPTESKDNVAMTITGLLKDQNGDPIKDTKLGIFNVSTLEYQEFGKNGVIGDDGRFSIDYGPLTIGEHELILAANAVAEHHDTTWTDSVPVFDGFQPLPWMTDSTPENTEAMIGVAARKQDGSLAVGVPVTFHRSDFNRTVGEELGTVTTNEFGIAEFKVTETEPLTEAFETVYYLAKYKDKEVSLSYTRSNVRPTAVEFTDFSINATTQIGKSAVVKCALVDKLGTPMTSLQGLQAYHLPTFKGLDVSSPDIGYGATGVYAIETAETFGDYKLEAGTHPMVLWHRSSNARIYFDLVVVDEDTVVTPAKIVLTENSPTVGMVNESGYFPVMAQAQDADGNPFKPAYGIQVGVHRKMNGVDYDGGYAHIGPNGEVYSTVTPKEAGDYTFWFEDQEYDGDAGENYGEFELTFRDDLLVEMSKATTETVPHGEQASLVARAMNQVHQGVANVWVDFTSEEMYGRISGGTTDQHGYATGKASEAYVVSINNPEIITVKAHVGDVASEETIVVTWDGVTKAVTIDNVVVPDTVLPNKVFTVSGVIHDKDGNVVPNVEVQLTDKVSGKTNTGVSTSQSGFNIDMTVSEIGTHDLLITCNGAVASAAVNVELIIPDYDKVEKLPYSTQRSATDGQAFFAFAATKGDARVMDVPITLHIQGVDRALDFVYTDPNGYASFNFKPAEPTDTVLLEFKVGTESIGSYEVTFTDDVVASDITEILSSDPTVNGQPMLFDVTISDQNETVIVDPVIAAFDLTNLTPLTITPVENSHGRGLYSIEGKTDASIEVVVYSENARFNVFSTWSDEPLADFTSIAIDDHDANPNEGEEVELTGHLLYSDDEVENERVKPNTILVAKLTDTDGGEMFSTLDTEGAFLFPLSYAEYTKKTYTVSVGEVSTEAFDIEWGHLEPPTYTSVEWVGEQPANGEVGTPITLRARSLDQYGDPIEGVSVRPFINGEPGSAFRSPPGGEWSFDYNATEAGEVTYEFGWEPNIARIKHTVTWALPEPVFTKMEFVSAPTEGTTGENVVITVKPLDQFDRPMAGQSVAWSNGGTNLPARTSDPDGIATFTASAADAGDVTYTFVGSGEVANLTHTVSWVPPKPITTSMEIIGENIGVIGETVPVQVIVKDQFGQPMPNVSVVWSDGGIPFPQSMTDKDGQITYQFSRDKVEEVTYKFDTSNNVKGQHVINWVSNVLPAEGLAIQPIDVPVALAGQTFTISGETTDRVIPEAKSITIDEMEVPLGTTTGTTTISGNAS